MALLLRSNMIDTQSAPQKNSRRRILRRLFLFLFSERLKPMAQEKSCWTMFPSRTNVIGRPVVLSYSSVGSIPKL